jgi:hypothetical protein
MTTPDCANCGRPPSEHARVAATPAANTPTALAPVYTVLVCPTALYAPKAPGGDADPMNVPT